MGVEQPGGIASVPMPGVVGAERLAAARCQECLAVGAGHVGGPEQGGERMPL